VTPAAASARKILFVGAGAIGSYLGAFLARAGHDVMLVDPWAEQIEAIRQRGIAVTGPHEPFQARPGATHLHEAARLPRDYDIVFVAMKAYDTAWATQLAVRHLGPQGFVVSAQNCWPDPIAASVAGPGRAVGLVMSKIGVAMWRPGEVERGIERGSGAGHVVFRAGEHDGRITPRVEALAAMLTVVDGAQATDNLWGERWAKLCQNAMGNPVQAISGLGSGEVATSEVGRALTLHLAAEGARVGLALGYRIPSFGGVTAETWADPAARTRLDDMLRAAAASGKSWRASMAQDVVKGRRTEIDFMNGHVAACGRERGVPTPVSEAIVAVVHEVETGSLEPRPQNMELVLRRAGV
jgi:2-dehydropantoate 2-reductase